MRQVRWAARAAAVVVMAAAGPVSAQQASSDTAQRPVWRCPGPPVEYTNELTAEQARERGCRVIEATPVTVVQPPPRPPAGTAPGAGAQAGAPGGAGGAGAPAVPVAAARPEARIDASAQRARDAEARRILEGELRREEERLGALRREFNNGEPERRGDERNYARYQERVSELRAAIARKESDVAALRREIAKLAAP
ncbi:MAG: hypothetical protein RI988_2540 [Pseudomonadota bacterium]